MVTEIVMPRLSLTMKIGSVIQWFKKEGEEIQKGEPVVEVLSEKVTYEVEAPASGILRKILANEGVDLPIGATLALITAPNEELPEIKFNAATQSSEKIEEILAEKKVKSAVVRERILASPAAKRMARDNDIDLALLEGSGPNGRIVEEDVEHFIEESARPKPHVKREIPLMGIRKITAKRLTSSFQTAPHSFIIMDVDMTKAVKLKEKTKTSYTAMLIKAVAETLRDNLVMNSTIADDRIRIYEDINIGVAVSTEKGLVVPVIRNADKKLLEEISTELNELTEKAREGKLSKEELTGGTFTVTNLGMYGVSMFLPIINPPEAAILAAGGIFKKPVVADDEVKVKPILTLVLAYDHRIIDGAPASIFLRDVKKVIEEGNLE